MDVQKLRKFGPTRVVTKVRDGAVAETMTVDQALLEYGIVPVYILVRNDGWSLGCDDRTKEAAWKAWEGEWDCIIYPEGMDVAEKLAFYNFS